MPIVAKHNLKEAFMRKSLNSQMTLHKDQKKTACFFA